MTTFKRIAVKNYEFQFKVKMPHSTQKAGEANRWCRQEFGAEWSVANNRSGTWRCFWRGMVGDETQTHYEYQFVNSDDILLFILRWS